MTRDDQEEPDLSIPGNPDGSPPLVRLTGENGFALYPKMVPDGKGGWRMADPDSVAQILSAPTGGSVDENESGKPGS